LPFATYLLTAFMPWDTLTKQASCSVSAPWP